MVVNPAKFQLMFLGNGSQIVNLIISTDRVKLLGLSIDRDLFFKSHIDNICKSATSKTNALLRIRPYIDTERHATYTMHMSLLLLTIATLFGCFPRNSQMIE